jgi:hypothetical protein
MYFEVCRNKFKKIFEQTNRNCLYLSNKESGKLVFISPVAYWEFLWKK